MEHKTIKLDAEKVVFYSKSSRAWKILRNLGFIPQYLYKVYIVSPYRTPRFLTRFIGQNSDGLKLSIKVNEECA